MCGGTARALMLVCLLLTACATLETKELEVGSKNESVAIALIQVEPTEPFFRMHQAEALVRFFDVKNTKTGQWTRVQMTGKAKRFITRLSPGRYELVRLQIGEGPFLSETYMNMSFEVHAEKTNYLGIWRLRVDPPKTVRMLQLDVLAEAPDWDLMVALYPELGEKALVASLAQPVTNQNRLFAVAPSQPRAKYFYRR